MWQVRGDKNVSSDFCFILSFFGIKLLCVLLTEKGALKNGNDASREAAAI